MQSYGAEVQGLTYNAVEQSYEAKVVFHEAFEKVTYPVALQAPITADFKTISRGLVLRARALRARGRGANVAHLKRVADSAADSGRLTA
ncbi:MAG: hypothetical protein HWE33_15010 [Rhodobacteraceae bacterium]|uniref:hypothetical protein n=1 Tax=Celeribacter sp. HF31 TaxID=2721558 RepID=UPI00142FF085|nr:hypothetical protein [Celeribacter sp. HF31]NIY79589.1 hypothetical protein [Celeribacter sp. HF31]NVK47605.1 hypothetical protein [Paracoccaceae bacterium]